MAKYRIEVYKANSRTEIQSVQDVEIDSYTSESVIIADAMKKLGIRFFNLRDIDWREVNAEKLVGRNLTQGYEKKNFYIHMVHPFRDNYVEDRFIVVTKRWKPIKQPPMKWTCLNGWKG